MTTIQVLIASAFFCWFQLTFASVLASRGWNLAGMQVAFGNRENMPTPTGLVGRAQRAASNTVENLPIFLAVVLAASMANAPAADMDRGATVFFAARVAHWGLYLAGVPLVRSIAWAVSLAGMAMIAAAAQGLSPGL